MKPSLSLRYVISVKRIITSHSLLIGILDERFTKCPKCDSVFTYEDGDNYVCPECGYEWPRNAPAESGEQQRVYKDAFGNVLQDGDSVTVLKDLKVKGSPSVVKV